MHIHYSVSGAIRNEIIYATQNLLARKLGVEVIVAPFTHHLAICLRISIALPIMRKGRGLWKMYIAVIIGNVCTEKFRIIWGCLQRQKGYFADSTEVLEDNSDANRPDGEKLTIYYILQTNRRLVDRTVYCLRDEEG